MPEDRTGIAAHTNQVQVLGEKGRYTYATVSAFVPARSAYYITVSMEESVLNINSWSEMRQSKNFLKIWTVK